MRMSAARTRGHHQSEEAGEADDRGHSRSGITSYGLAGPPCLLAEHAGRDCTLMQRVVGEIVSEVTDIATGMVGIAGEGIGQVPGVTSEARELAAKAVLGAIGEMRKVETGHDRALLMSIEELTRPEFAGFQKLGEGRVTSGDVVLPST